MATVPLQQTPTVELDVGQAPLFSATNIEPVRDTGVAEDIQRVGNAQKLLAQVAIKNKEEQDDVVSNDAFNGYQEEADAKVNEYLDTRLGAAVATVASSPLITIEGTYFPVKISNNPLCISSLFFIKQEVL